ncbi:alginate lyase family protein [Haloarcula salina]|uniref:alginate lyase family protein n=1 Tax=Haloarcula salina TaxID=1429914 RepID=UPI003C704E62
MLLALSGATAALGGCSTGLSSDDANADSASQTTPEGERSTSVQEQSTASQNLPPGSPAMFVDIDTLAAIRSRVERGDSPWSTAYEAFMSDVREAMDAAPESVTDNGDGHEFKTKGPNDPEERKDYVAAIRTGDRIRDLGLAYRYHEEDQYAEKAVELLDHWFLNAETRMAPVVTNSIEQFITLPKMWWGAELVRGHEAWDDGDVGTEADLQEWIRTFLDDVGHEVETSMGQQNIFNWQEMAQAAGAVYCRDWDRFRTAMQRNREVGFTQLREDGLLENEIIRASSLAYSLYAAKALVTAAELSRLYADKLDGPTLYEYQKFDGDDRSAIELILDAHAPYVADPEAWEALGEGDSEVFENVHGFPARKQEAASALYEVAYSYYQKEAYLEAVKVSGQPVKNVPTYVSAQQVAIDDPGRPHRDERILGWTTFSHGERFRLDL